MLESKLSKIMANETNKKIEIDLKREDTEFGWQISLDNFALKGVSIWFSWIGWAIAIAALNYLSVKSGNTLIKIIELFSILFLFYYYQAFFYRINFKGLPFVKNAKIQRIISLIFSAILAYGFWYIAITISKIVAKSK